MMPDDSTPQPPPNDPYARPSDTPPQANWPPPPVTQSAQFGAPISSPVNGTLILILGILGLTICGICAPVAWVMGNQALATLSQYGDPLNQRGIINGGRICGIIGSILIAVVLVVYAIAFAFGFAGALTHPSRP